MDNINQNPNIGFYNYTNDETCKNIGFPNFIPFPPVPPNYPGYDNLKSLIGKWTFIWTKDGKWYWIYVKEVIIATISILIFGCVYTGTQYLYISEDSRNIYNFYPCPYLNCTM